MRWAISKGVAWFERYAKEVAATRRKEAAKRLWRDVKEQGAAGNQGRRGEWIEQPTKQPGQA